jgi:hypothetical protein
MKEKETTVDAFDLTNYEPIQIKSKVFDMPMASVFINLNIKCF